MWWPWLVLAGAVVGMATRGEGPGRPGRAVELIAHRGAWRQAPQNSLPALRAAIGLGLDYCEVDVRTTADGRLVDIHNSEITDRAGNRRKVKELTWAELSQIEIGRAGDERCRVPLLSEELAAGKGKIGFYLDWKDAEARAIVDLLQRHGMAERVLVHGDPDECRAVQKLDPRIPLLPGAGSEEEIQQLHDTLRPAAVEVRWLTFTEGQAHLCRRLGMRCVTSFSGGRGDKPEDMRRAIAAGVQVVETDQPEVFLRVLGEVEGER